MSNSTAYELRYRVLVDAKDMLLMDYDQRCMRASASRNVVGVSNPAERKLIEDTLKADAIPTLPTAADIIKVAEELYVFVKNKN